MKITNLTALQLENLKENFKNTDWFDVREEKGELIASHFGLIHYNVGNGYTLAYSGQYSFKIYPSDRILNNIFDCGSDQRAFINSELDFCPL